MQEDPVLLTLWAPLATVAASFSSQVSLDVGAGVPL